MKNKNLRTAVLAFGAVAAIGLSVAGVWATQQPPAKPHTAATQAAQPKKQAAADYLAYSGEDGKTALALLRTHATIVTKDSSYGAYVDSINGVKSGTGGKYWTFYVNGTMASVGADAYQTKAGDKIEWKLQ